MKRTKPRRGLTNPRSAGDVPTRIHRLLTSDRRDVPNAAAMMRRAVRAPAVQPCLNPGCGQTCDWPVRGRPSYFCSRDCRRWYLYERAAIVLDVEALEQALAKQGGTRRQRSQIESELAQRRWALLRYLFDPAGTGTSLGQTDSPVSGEDGLGHTTQNAVPAAKP